MHVGQMLRKLRKEQRLTLLDVKERTGLSVSFLSDIERGRTNPSLDSLQKLSDFYDVPITTLLMEQPKEPLPGFAEFVEEVNPSEEMKEILLSIERRAEERALTKEDWKKFYYSLLVLLGREK
jgi:XRE family transcriptional regulator, regulator of sulfur utilization